MEIYCVFYPGDYESAPGLVAIFSTQEKAESYIQEYSKANDDLLYWDIKTVDYYEDVVAKKIFGVSIDRQGNITDIELFRHESKYKLVSHDVTAIGEFNKNKIDLYSFISHEHAIKKAKEALRTYQLGKYKKIQYND